MMWVSSSHQALGESYRPDTRGVAFLLTARRRRQHITLPNEKENLHTRAQLN